MCKTKNKNKPQTSAALIEQEARRPTWHRFSQGESHDRLPGGRQLEVETAGDLRRSRSEVKPWSVQAAKFKPLSTARGAVEETASRRGRQQEDRSRTLATCHYDSESAH